jgi:hypothetical protein
MFSSRLLTRSGRLPLFAAGLRLVHDIRHDQCAPDKYCNCVAVPALWWGSAPGPTVLVCELRPVADVAARFPTVTFYDPETQKATLLAITNSSVNVDNVG